MDFELTVNTVLPLVTGTSARGEWKKQDVVFDLPGEFNRKLCVGFWNDRAPEAAALRPGDRVALSVNVESREYNGRWYTEARAWRMTRLDPNAQAAAAGGYPPYDAAPGQPAAAPNYGGQAAASNYGGQQAAAPAVPAAAPTSADEVDDLPF